MPTAYRPVIEILVDTNTGILARANGRFKAHIHINHSLFRVSETTHVRDLQMRVAVLASVAIDRSDLFLYRKPTRTLLCLSR
jgi:hypothetical protein